MAAQPLDYDPGSYFAYSNFGYLLLGEIITAVTGQRYEDYVQENIFAPLGMTQMALGRTLPAERLINEATYYNGSSRQPRENVIDPTEPLSWAYGGYNLENLQAAAGWVGSAVEMARFSTAFDDVFNSPLLSGDFVNVMFRPPTMGINADGYYYGCGWNVRPMEYYHNTWHDGTLAGVFTFMLRRFDGMNWVVFFNQRRDRNSSRNSYYDIDWMLYNHAETVLSVPDHDLFDSYL